MRSWKNSFCTPPAITLTVVVVVVMVLCRSVNINSQHGIVIAWLVVQKFAWIIVCRTFVNPLLALKLDFQRFLEVVWPLPPQLRENSVIQNTM